MDTILLFWWLFFRLTLYLSCWSGISYIPYEMFLSEQLHGSIDIGAGCLQSHILLRSADSSTPVHIKRLSPSRTITSVNICLWVIVGTTKGSSRLPIGVQMTRTMSPMLNLNLDETDNFDRCRHFLSSRLYVVPTAVASFLMKQGIWTRVSLGGKRESAQCPGY